MLRPHWKTTRSLLLAAVLPLAVACQGEQAGDAGMQDEPMADEPAEMEMDEPMGQSEVVELSPMGDAAVTGDVEFTREGNTLSVEVMASMGAPGDYPSHIHEGTCDQPGGVAVPLNSGTAAEEGIAEATTEVDVGQLEAGSSYLVMVHSQQGAPAACAEVPSSLLQS